MGGHQIKSLMAKAKYRGTLVERFAEAVVTWFGSTTFLVANIIWFVVWIMVNTSLVPGVDVFDPFPFSLLTTVVSLEAIALSILVLMAQNRAAKIGDLREEMDLQLDIITEKELTKALEILSLMAEKQGLDLSKDEALQEMLEEVDREKIEHILEAQIGKQSLF